MVSKLYILMKVVRSNLYLRIPLLNISVWHLEVFTGSCLNTVAHTEYSCQSYQRKSIPFSGGSSLQLFLKKHNRTIGTSISLLFISLWFISIKNTKLNAVALLSSARSTEYNIDCRLYTMVRKFQIFFYGV